MSHYTDHKCIPNLFIGALCNLRTLLWLMTHAAFKWTAVLLMSAHSLCLHTLCELASAKIVVRHTETKESRILLISEENLA